MLTSTNKRDLSTKNYIVMQVNSEEKKLVISNLKKRKEDVAVHAVGPFGLYWGWLP